MMPLLADWQLVDDGPVCPDCGSTRWRVEIEAVERSATSERVEIQLRVVEIVCRECDMHVQIDEDDEGDTMRWRPDPSGEPLRDLPSTP